ncbi:hypothetical protein [Sulfobacillus harzensis]|uniref:Uncharacterized protein n=1 Tax=Sulfobacillus harzensis TaxID=2729629 RepID=A0A7Y0L2A9_9FIRM|nr:hypothetical protein [Sulfobacillus harzensis]NMP21910.1 hypothetical protein [Sulfobacillus harzensis]
MGAKAPLIDAEVLNEFFEKAELYLTPEFLAKLSDDLTGRCRAIAPKFPTFPDLWDLAPATRRLPADERQRWAEPVERLRSGICKANVADVLDDIENWESPPKWLLDWATFWMSIVNPELLWWARWVYAPRAETGALVLLVDNPISLKQEGLRATYGALSSAAQYLGALLESTRSLQGLDAVFQPQVTLAVVYSVYMFTMASWKLTEEFTRVLPPFPVVVRTLLGINRWEGR